MRPTSVTDIVANLRSAVQEAAAGAPPTLTEGEQIVLAIEGTWWLYRGVKEQVVREALGVSETRYYQVLAALIDRPEALAHDPLTVKRLLRQRERRAEARRARRLIEG